MPRNWLTLHTYLRNALAERSGASFPNRVQATQPGGHKDTSKSGDAQKQIEEVWKTHPYLEGSLVCATEKVAEPSFCVCSF